MIDRFTLPATPVITRKFMIAFVTSVATLASSVIYAQSDADHSAHHDGHVHVGNHAPIGVMGDHLHAKGEWMLSYRYMSMRMEDNIRGSDSISPEEIVSAGLGLRVVPVEMTTNMHMFGAMYAPTDNLTLMLMLNYIEKEMDHITFQGMMGTTELGMFTTETSGIGDTKLSALYGIFDSDEHHVHLNLGLSIPTGSIDETDDILTPMNTRPTRRIPYPMQLGSGTYDIEPGITYTGKRSQWDWGTQLKLLFRLDDNDEGYSRGDTLTVSSCGSYRFSEWVAGSLRLTYSNSADINGADPQIALPVPTAQPRNFGGEKFDLGVGVNLIGNGNSKGHRAAIEYTTTIEQHRHGIQMEMQDMVTLGYQFSF